jgi:hypothetical protein
LVADFKGRFNAGTATQYQVIDMERRLNESVLAELDAQLRYRRAEDAFERVQQNPLSDRTQERIR